MTYHTLRVGTALFPKIQKGEMQAEWKSPLHPHGVMTPSRDPGCGCRPLLRLHGVVAVPDHV
jgi:hypothetical protein